MWSQILGSGGKELGEVRRGKNRTIIYWMKKILLSIQVGGVRKFKVRIVRQHSEMVRSQNKQVFPDDNTWLPCQQPWRWRLEIQ